AEDGIRAFHVTGVQTCALPISSLQATFHIDGTTLTKILASDLRQAVIEHDTVPFRFLTALTAVLVFPLRSGSQGHVADRCTIGEIGRASCRERGKSSVAAARSD